MRSRPVTSGESLSRNNKRSSVRAEVLEEVGEAVEEHECLLCPGGSGKLVISEAHDDEKDGKDNEAHHLDWFTAPAINEEEGSPVTGDETGHNEDEVANGDIAQVLVDSERASNVLAGSTVTDGGENDGRVQTETVESNLKTRQLLIFLREYKANLHREQTMSKNSRSGPSNLTTWSSRP